MLEIIIIEDNPADAELCEIALEEAGVINPILIFDTAEAASVHLNKSDKPGLILLDINLPGQNGIDFLKDFRKVKTNRPIPIVILTSSSYETDILKSYATGANAFLTKPLDFREFKNTVSKTADFWFNIVAVPSGGYILK